MPTPIVGVLVLVVSVIISLCQLLVSSYLELKAP